MSAVACRFLFLRSGTEMGVARTVYWEIPPEYDGAVHLTRANNDEISDTVTVRGAEGAAYRKKCGMHALGHSN